MKRCIVFFVACLVSTVVSAGMYNPDVGSYTGEISSATITNAAQQEEINTWISTSNQFAKVVSNNTYSAGTTQDMQNGDVLVPTPTANAEAANKSYVDAQVSAAGATNFVFGELLMNNNTNVITFGDTTTWYIVENWTAGDSAGITLSGSNFVIAADGVYDVDCHMSGIQGPGGNKKVQFAIFKNGALDTHGQGQRFFSSTDIGMGSIGLIDDAIAVGDTYDLRCRLLDTPASGSVIFQYGSFKVRRAIASSSSTNWSQYPAQNNVTLGDNWLIQTNAGDVVILTNAVHGYSKGYNATSSWEIIGGNKYVTHSP